MSTRVDVTLTNSALSAASLPLAGAVPNTRPPVGGMARMTSHGMVTSIDTGACEMSGAVTSASCPPCGQFRFAVVCTTGSSGVAADSRKASRPAMIATQRTVAMSRPGSRAGAGVASWFTDVSLLMGVPGSVPSGSSRTRA